MSSEGFEKVVDVIHPGHSFAEAVMFLGKKRYPLNATALGYSKVLRINIDCYLKYWNPRPNLALK
ncbi:hypothetical protein BSPWISOXPB_1748 [uncultured Gammaproteobacteria bacterium]|nr:hypothetical protein BSPWISOXPB_1748 [uncultured Gammaproteobacteria bacterium]